MSEHISRLFEFALGLLEGSAREELERELDASPELRRELDQVEEALGQVAFAVEPLRPSERIRDSLLAGLDPSTRFEGFVERVVAFFDLPVDRAREILSALDDVAGGAWEAGPAPGSRVFHLDGGSRVAAADCGLVHVEPGRVFHPHRHIGDEWSLVLQGRAQEDSGRFWDVGDILYKPPGSVHGFRALGDVPFVFAVVLHEGIEDVDG